MSTVLIECFFRRLWAKKKAEGIASRRDSSAKNCCQYTVEPRLSGLFDYPDMLSWSQFFMNINQSYFCPQQNFFLSNYAMKLRCGVNLFRCKAQISTCFVLTPRVIQCISVSFYRLRFAPSLSEISSSLSSSVLLLAR